MSCVSGSGNFAIKGTSNVYKQSEHCHVGCSFSTLFMKGEWHRGQDSKIILCIFISSIPIFIIVSSLIKSSVAVSVNKNDS